MEKTVENKNTSLLETSNLNTKNIRLQSEKERKKN